MEELREELKRVKEIVRKILAEDEKARNSDKYLTYKVMKQFTNIAIPFEEFEKIPTFESVRRTRQILQNREHLFMPTDEDIIQKRKSRQKEFKEWSVDHGRTES